MVINVQELAAKRRYFMVGTFVATAMFTPPDVLSQFAVAIPLLLFYEAVVAVVRWSGSGQ